MPVHACPTYLSTCTSSRRRLARARETLEEARTLAESEFWTGCVNRLYYACFYAVTALLLRDGRASPKHTGVRALFNQHVVRAGRLSAELGDFYNRLDGDLLFKALTSYVEPKIQLEEGRLRDQKLGGKLLVDALFRSLHQGEQVGAWAVVVDAIDENAVGVYEHFGFQPLVDHPDRRYIPLATIARLYRDTYP